MVRKLALVTLMVGLGVFGYGVYLEIRGDPTLAVTRQAQVKLDVQLNSATQLLNSQQEEIRRVEEARNKRRDREIARQKAILSFRQSLKLEQAVGRLFIPRLNVEAIVVDGSSADTDSERYYQEEVEALKKGPTRYPQASLPGLGRTTAIAGHRTTYGAWFRNIDQLQNGNLIVLQMPYGKFRYRVFDRKVVSPRAWEVIKDRGFEALVLTTCEPVYSAEKRLVVFAKLAA